MKKWMLHLKEERASATLVEYTIVLPICLFVIGFLFVVAYFMNQRALLDAAVERGVIDAQKIFSDPNSDVFIKYTDGDSPNAGYELVNDPKFSNMESDPYRFLNNGYNYDFITDTVKKKVKKIIDRNKISDYGTWFTEPEVECSKVTGFISKSITVTVRQDFYMPLIPLIMRKDGMFDVEMVASAKMPIMCSPEFIRNTDFIMDTIERATGVDIYDKVVGFFDKIKGFFKNTTKSD